MMPGLGLGIGVWQLCREICRFGKFARFEEGGRMAEGLLSKVHGPENVCGHQMQHKQLQTKIWHGGSRTCQVAGWRVREKMLEEPWLKADQMASSLLANMADVADRRGWLCEMGQPQRLTAFSFLLAFPTTTPHHLQYRTVKNYVEWISPKATPRLGLVAVKGSAEE